MAKRKDTPYYSLAICPEGETLERVSILKQRLFRAINWFPSFNSLAHITIDEFDADEAVLQLRKVLIQSCMRSAQNKVLTFDAIGCFDNARTIYLAPDLQSRAWLKSFKSEYYKYLYKRKGPDGFNPHITIGRNIDPILFEKAKGVFQNEKIQLTFACDNVALRKLNVVRRQFDIIERFPFG